MTEHLVKTSDEVNTEDTETAGIEAFIDTDTQQLYPSVQRAMDNLKKLIHEHAEDTAVRYTAAGEPIITGDIIASWSKEEGFGNGKRGTFHNEDTYVYVKNCHLVQREEDIDTTLATARQLTSLGAIHPESQWGVFESDFGYQLIVVSPKLEAWSLEKKLEGDYEERAVQPEQDNSHLEAWFQRIDPEFVPGQPIPENSLLHHLNWTEAAHPDNWGWDKTGTLFPVDVEVLRPTELTYKNYEPWKPMSLSSQSHYLDV